MKAQAVRRSARFMFLRAWGRRAADRFSPHFVVALCSLGLFACVYTITMVFLASAP